LPAEIVLRIVEEICFNDHIGKWRFIKKQVRALQQSIKFMSISIEYRKPDKKQFFKLMQSPFKPGNCVNSISFSALGLLADLVIRDASKDAFQDLGKTCPNVKNISIIWSRGMELKEWAYFTTAPLRNDT
jgi:hypothetical protein